MHVSNLVILHIRKIKKKLRESIFWLTKLQLRDFHRNLISYFSTVALKLNIGWQFMKRSSLIITYLWVISDSKLKTNIFSTVFTSLFKGRQLWLKLVYTEENIAAQNLSLKPNKLGAPKAQLFTSRHQPGLKPPPNVGAKKVTHQPFFCANSFPLFASLRTFFILQPHLAQTKNLFLTKEK